jgi:hypothetical protein
MYLINTLSSNGFKVILGFTDTVGILASAVGADSISNGWWKSLKLFSRNQYYNRGGGQRPRMVYTSTKLLNSVFIDPELQSIVELGYGSRVLANTGYDSILSSNPAQQNWNADDAALHYWKVTKSLLEQVERAPADTRIVAVENMIRDARTLYTTLIREGINFEAISGPSHLRTWLEAIAVYKQGI